MSASANANHRFAQAYTQLQRRPKVLLNPRSHPKLQMLQQVVENWRASCVYDASLCTPKECTAEDTFWVGHFLQVMTRNNRENWFHHQLHTAVLFKTANRMIPAQRDPRYKAEWKWTKAGEILHLHTLEVSLCAWFPYPATFSFNTEEEKVQTPVLRPPNQHFQFPWWNPLLTPLS